MNHSRPNSFFGEYRRTVDKRNRFTIPAPWRAPEGEDAIFLAVPQCDESGNRFIDVMTGRELESLHAKIAAIPMSDIKCFNAIHRFFSRTRDASCDRKGRATLSTELLQHAGITREIVLVGALDNFFIYNPETWERVSRFEEDPEAVLHAIARGNVPLELTTNTSTDAF